MKTSLVACALSVAIILAHTGSADAAALDIQVLNAGGMAVPDAAVYAEPLSPQAPARARAAEIEQKGRKFLPLMTVVQTGAEISFPNNDTVRHHVYSFSATKPFELKLYTGTPGKPVLFDKPGTVILGCNIHDQMVSYIQVVDTPHFGKTDAWGKVRIADLRPGKYRLKAWHFQLPPSTPATEAEISVAKADMAVSMVVGIKAADGAD